ncbi:MAG: malto-oligosyltrehalose trehalohydrolase [Pseudomonadota bacterium]
MGAEITEQGHTHFRVWAPHSKSVAIVERFSASLARGRTQRLNPELNGFHSGFFNELSAGALYSVLLDSGLYPDPASRFQPEGPHGPSQVVNAKQFEWRDAGFREPTDARVIYELHVGTFTAEGTYRAAAKQLAELANLGITVVELMSLAAFAGQYGWSYDSVDLWAPSEVYGTPDDLRELVATAHAHGIAVILDVVYNHVGQDGNYLHAFSPDYFSRTHECEWGEAFNFDGPNNGPVRQFVIENARYWLEEFHFDGLRLDATQSVFDDTTPHVLAEITDAARGAGAVLGKPVFIVGENEPQDPSLLRSTASGGYGLDAVWNDDFHHSARVALTGRREAYCTDYAGSPQELISALKWGYLYQGQRYQWQHQARGKPALDIGACQFVVYLQNHDQVANQVPGERIDRCTSAAELRAMTGLMLLSPPTPMLFQGQEFAASSPFLYFTDQEASLLPSIEQGRREFLSQFPTMATDQGRAAQVSASARSTFERCKLDFSERERHAPIYRLHRDLLRLRREDPALRQRRSDLMHGAVLGERALCLRFLCPTGDRLLISNFGADLTLAPAPEPLLAPPDANGWQLLWCSEDYAYDGHGIAAPRDDGVLVVPARCTLLYGPKQEQNGEQGAQARS